MNHVFTTPDDCDCYKDTGTWCPICDGGLTECRVCGGVEAFLTSDCPGYRLPPALLRLRQEGEVDFSRGQWCRHDMDKEPEEAQLLSIAITLVLREYRDAVNSHGPFHSAHEGFAVLKEEADELWEEVKAKNQDRGKMMVEAVQVAAMALRFIIDSGLKGA